MNILFLNICKKSREIFFDAFQGRILFWAILAQILLPGNVLANNNLQEKEAEVQVNQSKNNLVYSIPIKDEIDKTNLFILRRGLKEAIQIGASTVVLDIDTPGGRLDITLEMMEMLDYFDGQCIAYVNPDAISAGAFIASACDQIYFSPKGKMGAAALIQTTGEDIPETARLKTESYLLANVRILSQEIPYRTETIRAMFDSEYELVIDGVTIKSKGELLTLTASQAMERYGQSKQPLLGSGIGNTVEQILQIEFKNKPFSLENYVMTYSEEWAKWLSSFTAILIGLGMLLIFIEFKTPGFGIFGISGIILIGLFFISQNLAGLSGNEGILIFIAGLTCLALELFLFPGGFIFGLIGLLLIVGSFIFSMADFWSGQLTPISFELLKEPLKNLTVALLITTMGGYLFVRLFKTKLVEDSLILSSALDSNKKKSKTVKSAQLIGLKGIAITRLCPSGFIQLGEEKYEAHSELTYIEKGDSIYVCSVDGFKLNVKKIN